MVKVRFSASGYGSSTTRHGTRQEAARAVEEEALELAAEHGLDASATLQRYDGEWVLLARSGDELARWEILGE